jgi:hypothetical protein
MPRTNLWSSCVPRVELDQRSREARLRLEQLERLHLPHAEAVPSRLRRLLCLFRLGTSRGEEQISRTRRPLSDRRPSRPRIRQSGDGRRYRRRIHARRRNHRAFA